MKRTLFLLPAIVAGLLAGWLATRWMRPTERSRPAPAFRSAPDAGSAPDASPTLSQLADDRLPAPEMPADPVQVQLKLHELSAAGRSPVRSALQAEVFRRAMTVGAVPPDLFLADENAPGALESIARLARSDPKKALAVIDGSAAWKQMSASHAEALRRRVFREWLKADPQAAFDGATDRTMAWSSSALTQAAVLRALFEEWAALDPAAASGQLAKLPASSPRPSRDELTDLLFARWHAADPAAASEWASTLPAEAARRLATMAAELSASSAAEKATVLLATAAPDRSDASLVRACADWLQADPAAAAAALTNLTETDPFWQHSAASVAQHWATLQSVGTGATPPDAAWLEQVPAGPKRDAFAQGLVAYGASNDIPFACEIVAHMEENRSRTQAMSTLAELWMRQDPMALSEWLARQPASPSRHAAVARFAELLVPTDPDAARRWAETLPPDSEQRAGILHAAGAAR